MDTLTDRYVHEVVRRLPEASRDDVGRELRATIADTLEARDDADPAAGERAVLTEMGDPIRLAARYADRPLTLIDPDLYPTYVRVLRALLATVVPVVAAIGVVADVVQHNDFGSAVGSAIRTVLTVGPQLFAWLTFGFFLLSRYQSREARQRTTTWTPDSLPSRRAVPRPRSAPIASAVWHAALAGVLVWQQLALPYRGGGQRLPVLDPALWSGPAWPILVGLVALIALDLVRATDRATNLTGAIGYALAEALFVLPLAWAVQRHAIFDPRFLAAVNGGWQVPDSFYSGAVLIILGIGVIEVLKRIREARTAPTPR